MRPSQPHSFPLGCFYHRPCYDFTQHPQDTPYDMVIPRASTNSAANSGSSTPSTHTERSTAHAQTNGNSVGRTLTPPPSPPLWCFFSSSHSPRSLSLPAHLQRLLRSPDSVHAGRIHSNFLFRFFNESPLCLGFFFLILLGSVSQGLVSLTLSAEYARWTRWTLSKWCCWKSVWNYSNCVDPPGNRKQCLNFEVALKSFCLSDLTEDCSCGGFGSKNRSKQISWILFRWKKTSEFSLLSRS